MRIATIGAGYVGLVSGACFSDFGYDVTCVDKDPHKIAELTAGRMPIYEPGLETLVARNVAAGRLRFSTSLADAVTAADIVLIAVGTPSRRGEGHADLTYVHDAVRQIAPAIDRYKVIVVKSTVPVGTGDAVDAILAETCDRSHFSVVSNPEFLREGAAIEDFKRPDRVVVGVSDGKARAVMEQLYRPLSLNQAPVMFTDRRSSELIKYAANAFLATKITFINEIADLCERVGADVQQVARGIGIDRRIGPKFLNAGPGYGGSCFPKDTLALVQTAKDHAVPLRIVTAVIEANTERKNTIGQKVVQACGGSVKGATIAILGLTYKPNTDDMRDAPSIPIIKYLQDAGAKIRGFDPEGMKNAASVMTDVDYTTDIASCLTGADAMVLVTEWDQFRALEPAEIKRRLKRPVVVDLRNVFRPDDMLKAGLQYVSIGR